MKKSPLIGGLLAAGAMSLFAYDVRQIFPENDCRFHFVNLTLNELFDGKGEFSGVVYTHLDGTPFSYPEIDSLVLSNTVRGFRFALDGRGYPSALVFRRERGRAAAARRVRVAFVGRDPGR
jgi:hypothetical protein